MKLLLESISEIRNSISKPIDSIINGGILINKGMLLIAGQQKRGKSILAANLALAISQGKSFAGFEIPTSKRTTLLSAEGGADENGKRINLMCKKFGEDFDESTIKICRDTRILFNKDDQLKSLLEILKETSPNVVIIDPLSKFHQYDENSSQEMSELMRRIRYMMDELNCATIITHHLGKDESRGARGSSVLSGEYDSYMRLKGNIKKSIQCGFDLRHSVSPDPKNIYLNSDTLWFCEKNIKATSIFYNLLSSTGSLSQAALVKKAVEAGINLHNTNVYRDIKKEITEGILLKEGDLIRLNPIS